MKKYLFIISFIVTSMVFGQQQLPNSSFEQWENATKPTKEPLHWSSLKTADALASMAPEVLSRVQGKDGNYAIQLEVISAFSIQANGIITNGRVHADFNPELGYVFADASDPQWNTPFTSRPDSIVGWFKYSPQGGDKGKIEINLYKGTHAKLPMDQTTLDNTIGRARYNFTKAESNWTRFSAPFLYNSTEAPEYVLATMTSGDSTQSVEGSIIIIDDLELIYNALSTKENTLSESIFAYEANGFLYFKGVEEPTEYKVFTISGRLIQEGKVFPKVEFTHNSGLYLIQIKNNKGVMTKKIHTQH